MPRVKLIHIGDNEWVAPTAEFGKCDHPRDRLRFDSRFAMPMACYCMDCGEAYIHPFHGMTEDEIEAHKEYVARKYAWLNEDS